MNITDEVLLDLQAAVPEYWSLHKEAPATYFFNILDTYDCSLLSSGAALLEFREESGKIELLPQEIEEKPDPALPQNTFPPLLLPLGEIRSIVEKAVGEWRLGVRTQGIESVKRYRLENEDKKGVARISLRTFQCADGIPITAVKVQPYRGYHDEVAAVRSRLEAKYPAAAAPPEFYRSLPDSVRGPSREFPGVQHSEGARTAVANLGQYLLDRVRYYEPGVIDDSDPEILHQYRVALRRIRSLVTLLKTVFSPEEKETLSAQLKLAMQGTNRLRDLDVQIGEVAAFRSLLPEMLHPGLAHFLSRLHRQRKAKFRSVRRSLVNASFDERFSPVIETLEYRDHKPVKTISSILSVAIRKRYRGIAKEIQGFSKEVKPEQLHCLRVSCKKLRYLLEFFPQILRLDLTKTLLKDLKKLQNLLGRYNDLSILEAFLAGQAKLHPEDGNELMAMGAVIMKTNESRNQLVERCIATAHDFYSTSNKRLAWDAVKGEKD